MFMNHLGLHFSEITIQIFTHLSLKLFVFLGTVVKALNGLEVCPPSSEPRSSLDSSLSCVEPQPTSLSPSVGDGLHLAGILKGTLGR